MSLKTLLQQSEAVRAPLVTSAMSAKLAERAGVQAIYLGGGSVGYEKAVTEANLTIHDMCTLALDIRTVCTLPMILDGAGGWGDPMHLWRTVRLAEAAGFAAIEIEDQQLPKRAHHHVGVDHPISKELMVHKVREAVRARRSSEFLIIARTNLARDDVGEAIERARAYKEAGADILFAVSVKASDLQAIGKALPAPLMAMRTFGGILEQEIDESELVSLGYRLLVDPVTPLLAVHRALTDSYRAFVERRPDPLIGRSGRAEQDRIHETIDLQYLLDIERRTFAQP